jgi:hypothetical protein
MQSLPTVNLVLFFSFFSGRTLHTKDKGSIRDVFPAILGDVVFVYELDCVGGILDSVSNATG